MGKECQSCVKEGIGCESVQKMMREIDELKKAKAHRILMLSIFSLAVVFAIISVILWRNMLLQPIMVQQMPESQLKDLSELFNAQFANLLTVLGFLITIFGFILPLINLYYQRQTLKEERESIKREVDRSLEIIKEQVKQAKEERKDEINKVRDELAKAIDGAKKNFQSRQDAIDKKMLDYDNKLAEYEKNRCWDNGYFMQQLAFYAPLFETKLIYYCNALPYFSKDPNSQRSQLRVDSILENSKMLATQVAVQNFTQDSLDHIFRQLDITKDNLSGNFTFCKRIDEIKDILEKKAKGTKPVENPLMRT